MDAIVNFNLQTDKTISTPTHNNDSLPRIDNNDEVNIEKKLRVEDFQYLRQCFNRSAANSVDISVQLNNKTAGSLTKLEFIEALESILDQTPHGQLSEKLFDKLNSKETGLINWNDFCTYILQFYQEEDYASSLRISPFHRQPKIRHIPHNKQEITVKILHLDNPVKLINISKEGYLGLWTSDLKLEKVYSAADELADGLYSSVGGAGQNRRRAGMWITDAIYMTDAHKLVLASTSRDLRFFTISNETFLEDFILFGVKNVPTCLDYCPIRTSGNTESVLLFGDDCGYIHLLYFKNPMYSLFNSLRCKTDPTKTDKATNHNVHRIFWDELKEHDKYVRYHSMGAIHREYIRKVLYVPQNNSVIASSGDNRNSLIISNINKLKKPYVFRLYKGCECFDYSKQLNLLITGGADYLARLWNPYVTQKNITVLEGHHASVIDIKINERLIQCYTLSKDAVVKAWDLNEFTCLQTISIRFPTTLGGKIPSFGPFPTDLYLNTSTVHVESSLPGGLVLACNDYISIMKLGQDADKDGDLTETHPAPISCAVYNSKFRQLITCANNSSMGAWDIETGRKAFLILDAHDGEEITCVTIDRLCRKIATGARNGIIKIWNSASGQNLHVLPNVEDAEITGILFSDKGLITVGWSRKIVKYPDIVPEERVDDQKNTIEVIFPKADLSWRGSQIHRDDILCLESLMPISNIMCTASYDGEINVWSIDTEKRMMCLRKASKTDIRYPSANYRRSATRRLIPSGPVPVDQLLFLRHRAKENMKFGVLFSSEAGYLHCWSLYGERKDMGMFYSSSRSGESVLAMSTDAINHRLICGDTHGEIRIWNIEHYCCTTVSPVQLDLSAPPLVTSWQAHLSSIIFCNWIHYKGNGDFILSGSTDHTTRLWTMNGEQIGIFGQRQSWNLDLLFTTNNEEQENVTYMDENENEKSDLIEQQKSLLPMEVIIDDKEEEERDKPPPLLSPTDPSANNDRICPMTSNSLDGSSISPWEPIRLGIPVERDLIQKKLKRQERRHRFGEIDGRNLSKGGVCVTPFALLLTQDIDDSDKAGRITSNS